MGIGIPMGITSGPMRQGTDVVYPQLSNWDLSAVDIAQLAHTADECILCHDG